MALKIWLPFNGDLKEQGLSNSAEPANVNATFSDIGLNGSCINFNGTNSYISLSNPLTSANTEFSICAWVKLTVSDSTQTIFTARNATGKGLAIFRLAGGKFRFDDGIQTSFSLTHTSTDWFHLCVTRKPNAKTLYINGVAVETIATTGNLSEIAVGATIGASSNNLANLNNWTTGSMCDFRIYDHCLSKKEVAEISKGLMIYYPCRNFYDDLQMKDCSGQGHHLEPTGTANLTLTDNGDGYFAFDGNTFFRSTENILIPKNHTISLWLKLNNLVGQHIMDWRRIEGTTDPGDLGIQPIFIHENGKLQYWSSDIKNNDYFNYVFSVGQWYHICLVASPSEVKLYVNGELQGSKVNKITSDFIYPLTIGARASDSNKSTANIKKIAIYSSLLNDDVIKKLYNSPIELDKSNNLFGYNFVDDDSIENLTNFKKSGIIESRDGCRNIGNSNLITMNLKELEDGSQWARIYHLDTSSGSVFTSAEVYDCELEGKFSKLKDIDYFKSDDGIYEFMLTYPSLSDSLYNRWKQTNSPNAAYDQASGYEAITTAWEGPASGADYSGPLTKVKSGSSAIYACNRSANWWAPIGQLVLYNSTGIPAANGSTQTETELWVRIDTLSYSSYMQLKKNYILTNDFIEF